MLVILLVWSIEIFVLVIIGMLFRIVLVLLFVFVMIVVENVVFSIEMLGVVCRFVVKF